MTKITANDGVDGDAFGRVVGISKNHAVVGAEWCEPDGLFRAGCAYIFKYNNQTSTWEQIQKLTASDLNVSNNFGTSVAIFNDYVIIGAYGAKQAYIFTKNESNLWQQTAILTSDANAGLFGTSVDITDKFAIVGDHTSYNVDKGFDTGSCHVFIKNSSNMNDSTDWYQTQVLYSNDIEEDDSFGREISITRDSKYIIVSGTGKDTYGSNSGTAYIFEYNNITNMFNQTAQLYPSGNASTVVSSSAFGRGVSISKMLDDETDERYAAIVGANGIDSPPYENVGAAFIFEKNESNGEWNEVLKATLADEDVFEDNVHFGWSVSIYETYCIAGAWGWNDNTGIAYVYHRNFNTTDTWEIEDIITADDGELFENFGFDVEIYDNRVIIGAPYDSPESVYIYNGITPSIAPTNMPTNMPTITTSSPTFTPTGTTSEPTNVPTVVPSAGPTDVPTVYDDSSEGLNTTKDDRTFLQQTTPEVQENSDKNKDWMGIDIIIVVVIIVGICSVCLIIGGYWYYWYINKSKKNDGNNVNIKLSTSTNAKTNTDARVARALPVAVPTIAKIASESENNNNHAIRTDLKHRDDNDNDNANNESDDSVENMYVKMKTMDGSGDLEGVHDDQNDGNLMEGENEGSHGSDEMYQVADDEPRRQTTIGDTNQYNDAANETPTRGSKPRVNSAGTRRSTRGTRYSTTSATGHQSETLTPAIDTSNWEVWTSQQVLDWIKVLLSNDNTNNSNQANDSIETFVKEFGKFNISGEFLKRIKTNEKLFNNFQNRFERKSLSIQWNAVTIGLNALI